MKRSGPAGQPGALQLARRWKAENADAFATTPQTTQANPGSRDWSNRLCFPRRRRPLPRHCGRYSICATIFGMAAGRLFGAVTQISPSCQYHQTLNENAITSPRRFPPPWSIEDIGAAFVVKDGSGQKLGYFYYAEEPGRRSTVKLLTKDEARRIAAHVAKLPGPLRKSE